MSAFKPKYQYRDGFVIRGIDAQTVGEECSRLSETIGLTPKTLLDANREVGTPLHDYFEWRDDVAAEKYRETQAGYIIRSIMIVEEQTQEDIKVFHSVLIGNQREYKPVDTIVKSQDLTAQLLESAKRELFAFQVKYNKLKDFVELSGVFASIEKLKERK